MGLAALRQVAADDFVRVEYIENTSNAYILTNVDLHRLSNPHFILDAYVQRTQSAWQSIFGCRWERLDPDSCFVQLSNDNKFYSLINKASYYLNDITVIQRHIFEVKDLMVYIDGTPFTQSSNLPRYPSKNFALLATYNWRYNTITDLGCKARIYSCKIYDGDTLVRDFIPMYQISKDTYGLWDRVENKFYTSPNGTKFIGGHQIIYDAEIEYLQSSGTQYIDLNFGFDKTDEVYTSFAILTTTNDKYINSPIIWNNNNNRFGMGYHNGGYCIGYGNNPTTGTLMSPKTANDTKIHNWEYKNYVFTITDLNVTKNVSSITFGGTTKNLRLFFGLNANTKAKIASYKHIKNGQTVIDLIPVRIENIGYMYDKVSGKLFGNNGSGSFILGQDTVVYDKI